MNESVSKCQKIIGMYNLGKISIPCITRYYQIYLDYIYKYGLNKRRQLIFRNEEVEVDETYFYKAKRGMASCRLAKNRYWVLGIVSRSSKCAVYYLLNKRNKISLIPIIDYNCREGTTIFCDCWPVYVDLKQIPSKSNLELRAINRIHFYINHSIQYVDPDNKRIHTNSIERRWRSLKQYIRQASPRKNIPKYLLKFWMHQFFNEDEFIHLVFKLINMNMK